MRRQDEIRVLYPTQDPINRTFLLSDLDRFAQAFDSEEILEFLEDRLRHEPDAIRPHAILITGLFLPPFTARRHGLVTDSAGVFSRLGEERTLQTLATKAVSPGRVRRLLRQAVLNRMEPLGQALIAAFPAATGIDRTSLLLALSFLPMNRVHEFLGSQVFGDTRLDFEVVWAWAHCVAGQLQPDDLVAFLDRWGPARPELLLTAVTLPHKPLLGLVERLAGRVDGRGSANLALVLSKQVGLDPLPAIERLIRYQQGWTAIYALRALEATGRPGFIDIVRRFHDRIDHPFVRQQAVRAAGGLPGDASIEFCLAKLRSLDEGIRAQALESLVRLGCSRDELEAAAGPLVTSSSLRVRVNALLATAAPDPGVLPGAFRELLDHPDPLPRIEAAYCLGYWQNRVSLELLGGLAGRDPHPGVRHQAMKSLSKYPTAASLPRLTHLALRLGDEEARTAARLMARLGAEDPPAAVQFLARQANLASTPRRRALLLEAMANLAGRAGIREVEFVLQRALTSAQPEIIRAALDGWKLLDGAQGVDLGEALAGMDASLDAEGRSVANLVAFLSGDLDSIDRLAAAVAAGGPLASAAIRATLELALLVGEVIGPQNQKLMQLVAGDSGADPGTDAAPAEDPVRYWRPTRVSRSYRAPDEGEFDIHSSGHLEAAEPAPEAPAGEPPAPAPAPAPEPDGDRGAAGPVSPRPAPAPPPTPAAPPPLVSGRINEPGPRLRKAIQKETYLVAPPEQQRALERSENALARCQRHARQGFATIRHQPILGVPVLAAGIIVAVLARGATGSRPAPEPPPPPVALTVVTVAGPVEPAGGPVLAAGDVIRVGGTVALGPGGRATLITSTGDRVRATGPGRLMVIEMLPDASELAVEIEGGSYEFDFLSGGGIHVARGTRSVGGAGIRMKVEQADEVLMVEPVEGEVRSQDAAGGTRTLTVGERVRL